MLLLFKIKKTGAHDAQPVSGFSSQPDSFLLYGYTLRPKCVSALFSDAADANFCHTV
jgi:hypothetical protein